MYAKTAIHLHLLGGLLLLQPAIANCSSENRDESANAPTPNGGQTAVREGTAPTAGETPDTGPPTLADLTGEKGGLIERWVMKGFHVSLDRELERDGRKYWQTQAKSSASI